MTTLVCVPYWNVPDLIETCVRSILAQTERDIAVLVVGDGEEPPLRIRDSRLDVYTLPENHGPYFAQQVALTASPFPRYAVVGADDWIEPDHLERLHAVGGSAVITGAVWFHDRKGKVRIHEAGYEVGLFDTDRLLELGGHNPAERMGQDTLMVRLLRLTGELRATHHPTYHRVKRDGSLMSSPRTGPGSKARNEMRYRNRLVFAAAQRLRSVDAIREHRLSLVPEEIADEVAEHAARLSARLGQEVAA
jgi:glycosyltransferase involved in cell wall biosynthesis